MSMPINFNSQPLINVAPNAAPGGAAQPTLSPDAQALLTNLAKNPQQLQAFSELVAAAVMASQALMQGWGSVAGNPQQQQQYQQQMQAQLSYLQQGYETSTSQANMARQMALQNLQINSQIGVPMPGMGGAQSFGFPGMGGAQSFGVPGMGSSQSFGFPGMNAPQSFGFGGGQGFPFGF